MTDNAVIVITTLMSVTLLIVAAFGIVAVISAWLDK